MSRGRTHPGSLPGWRANHGAVYAPGIMPAAGEQGLSMVEGGADGSHFRVGVRAAPFRRGGAVTGL